MNIIKKTNKMRLLSILLMICMVVSLLPMTAFAGSNQQGYWGNTEYNKHVRNRENITIAEVNADGDVVWQNVAYCYNMNRGYPVGTYDGTTFSNEYEFLATQDDATWKTLSENPGYTGNMKEVLTKIVFIGYPYDSNNGNNEIKNILKDQCLVDDDYIEDTFRSATQKAIWHITDKRPFRLPSSGAVPTGNTAVFVSEYVGKIIYERALAYTGDAGLETRLWKWKGLNNRNQHLLDTGYNLMEPDTGNLVITKTLEGDVTAEEAEGTLTFKVTRPDGTSKEYTLTDFTEGADGKYTLELNDIQVGEYTVEESTHDIDGKTVTVTYTVNGGQEATGDSATAEVTKGETATVAFKNNYSDDTGNLVITKTLEGDVTAEEAEGTLTFKVTRPDGTSKEYTLADFTNNNGVYTLEINDVQVGEYTVEESTHDIDGKTVTVTYTVNGGQEATGDSATAEVTKGETATVAFKNNYSDDTGNLVITKTLEGDVTAEEAEGTLTFKVTRPDGTSKEYTLTDFTEGADGKYTLELNDIQVGEYTVEESTHDIDGKTVTVTYTVNGGQEATGDSATAEVTKGETATVAFKNNYSDDTGNLVITKTLEGDVTAEEAEGTLTFKVTRPDGTSKEYTLADFTNNNGVYTLEINDVQIGEYTVEESTHDIDGKTVTVTYTVNGGQEATGDNATAEVTKGETATVAFKNNYSDDTGNLVITKALEGDVTAEEAEGTLTFKVTRPDGTSKEYTLTDFTEGADGKYTLELNDIQVGEYTVEESTHDIDGKTVTVTYTVNGGQEATGDSATAEVTKGETATVAFKNNYSDDTGNLVITKTLEGDVTAEEAEGTLTFKVTRPDGTSKEYTLADFTNNNGVYTLEINDVQVGEYTVEESTHDIDGKTVTVTYTVSGGQEATGDSASAEVTKGETATVAFKNNYSDDTGNLVITKTLEGDVTAEEAEGTLTFKVTRPDGTSKEYTLADFTNNNGVYTLEINDVQVGEYTVEESTHDIDGKTVTVTYTVNGGQEATGDNATAEVTKGETATVAFKNNYSDDTDDSSGKNTGGSSDNGSSNPSDETTAPTNPGSGNTGGNNSGNGTVSGKTTSPQTGDNSNMILWIALMFASCCGIVTTCVVKRKRVRSK